MLTLVEVIESIIKQSGLEIRNVRKPERDRFWVDRETYNDALHYLKEYQTMQTAYIKAMADIEDNPPLTWDELKSMEGKPVWVEINGYNGYWTIVHWNSNIVFEEYYDWIASPEDPMKAPLVSLDDTNFGNTWQAYRKERG